MLTAEEKNARAQRILGEFSAMHEKEVDTMDGFEDLESFIEVEAREQEDDEPMYNLAIWWDDRPWQKRDEIHLFFDFDHCADVWDLYYAEINTRDEDDKIVAIPIQGNDMAMVEDLFDLWADDGQIQEWIDGMDD